jgi:mono/diheme cytochrome c family protein
VAVPEASARDGAAPKGNAVAGKKIFKAECGSCHTLKAAGTIAKAKLGAVNFDRKKETFTRVFRVLVEGEGSMLSYTDRLTFKQLRDVATFVAASTKRNPSTGY